jgi:HK97 gp10 family phage protein
MAKKVKAKRVKARNIKAEIEGADEVIKTLEDLGLEAEKILQDAARKGGEIALREARKRCPERTGNLKRSLKVDNGKTTTSKAEVKVTHGKKEFYGTFVELGTSHMKAQPFLRPAVDENRAEISKAVKDEIVKAIGRVR